MDIHQAIQELVGRDARLCETAASVEALSESTRDLELRPFFEPVSAVVIENKVQRLLALRAEDLASWLSHVAASTFCRMRALEVPVLENLIAHRTLAAMTLLRSHFEAAAMAAYCLEELTDAARHEHLPALADLIPKTLFGTGLAKFRDTHTAGELLSMCEGDTIRICHAVEALDRFYYQEAAKGDLAVVYSLLCDFAHPNHRGVLGFMQSVERTNGWVISYVKDEPPDKEMALHASETLLVSMRAGYSAGEMLRCWHFSEQTGGRIDWRGPSPDDAARIWVRYLQRPIEGAV